jgi:BirA family biotin operon repressor/biotin-[acetyl-CoA-carboxylase] ligase
MNIPEVIAPKSLTFSLLRLLSDGEFHSGEVLAQQLGLSRASVSNALQNVDQYGLTLFSVRGRGYRLVNAPQWLDAGKVCAGLKTPAIFNIELADTAVSSNTILLQRAALGASSGSVLAVEWQSAGRGRLGRAWHSGLGNALTFSLLWRFEFGLSALSGLSLAVGVALMRALSKLDVANVGLKWPNDVVTGMNIATLPQGKIAGILIEAQGDMLGPSAVVIGIGLNLHLPPTVAQRIDQPVSDLAQVVANLPERNRLLALLLQELADMLSDFARHGFLPLRAEWESDHVYQNRQVKMLLPDGTNVVGVVRGVTDEGALRVETTQGVQIFHAGEISLREA